MRQQFTDIIERGRIITQSYQSARGDRFGLFQVRFEHFNYNLIACAAEFGLELNGPDYAWDHVSVRIVYNKNKSAHSNAAIPPWIAMQFFKEQFWDNEETVVQFHPPKSQYVNVHNAVLHLWKNEGSPLAMPPIEMV